MLVSAFFLEIPVLVSLRRRSLRRMFRGAPPLKGRLELLMKRIPGVRHAEHFGWLFGGFQGLIIVVALKSRPGKSELVAEHLFTRSVRESVRDCRFGGYLGMFVVAVF